MRRSLKLAVVAVAVVLLGGVAVDAAVINVTNYQGVGPNLDLDPARVYTHKLDFPGDGQSTAINGVQFSAVGTGAGVDPLTGNPYSLTMPAGAPSDWGAGSTAVLHDFIHNSGQPAGAVEIVSLSGLAAGSYYDTRLYYRNFGGRPNDVTIDVDGLPGAEFSGVLDQATASAENYWSVRFQAESPTITINLAQQQSNNSWHQYAVSNELLPGQRIADLFNTGVVTDDVFGGNATLVADGQPDPHYRFVSGPQSPSTAPQAQVQLNHSAWSANGPDSKWIGVSPNGTDGDQPGAYVYETTFTLPAGVDAATAQITGNWWVDDSDASTQIFLNGTNTGTSGTAPFGAALPGTPFTIDYNSGGAVFLTGTNTLTFQVVNGAAGPHGLRVNQMAGTHDPTDPNRVPIADLFNTGVLTDDEFGVNSTMLADGDPDPHYAFASGPQSPPTAPQAQVQLNHPAWSANGPDSKWIGVSAVGANAVAGGTYQYETTFTIPLGFDPETAEISGYWWVDDGSTTTQILLNGVDTGTSGSAPFSAAYPGTLFSIADGDGGAQFLSGTNSLVFQVLNGSAGPHGLRVTRLAGSYAVPEPGSLTILLLGGLGLLGYGLLRRKRVG